MPGYLSPFRWSSTLRSPMEMFAFCQAAAEFLRALSKHPILNGQLVEATFTASSLAEVAHQLGRPYSGAFVLSSTNASAYGGVVAFDALAFASLGGDPTKTIQLATNTAFTGTLLVWVF